MDYEKAYKAVLQTATQWIKDGCTDKEKICLECVFPELRESEDERIRKELIEALKISKTVGELKFILPEPTREECIAYLEKQKYDRMKPIYDARESFESALEKAWNDYHNGYEKVDKLEDDYVECAHAKGFREGYLFGLEKQKENPKSADSIPSDCVSDAKCEDKSPKHSDSDGTDIRDTPAYWKGWDDAMKQKEQKHSNGCFTCDEYEAGRLNGFTAGYNKAMKEIDQKEQKPADRFEEARKKYQVEWSEKDGIMLGSLINYFEGDDLDCTADDVVEWLKSLRPSWKPSEEQMKVLYGILVGCRGTWRKDTVTIMESLYQDLKKLM